VELGRLGPQRRVAKQVGLSLALNRQDCTGTRLDAATQVVRRMTYWPMYLLFVFADRRLKHNRALIYPGSGGSTPKPESNATTQIKKGYEMISPDDQNGSICRADDPLAL
jgi:hypothetical protein